MAEILHQQGIYYIFETSVLIWVTGEGFKRAFYRINMNNKTPLASLC